MNNLKEKGAETFKMDSPNISNDVLTCAKLVHAQLLIRTHTKELAKSVMDVYWIHLEICSMRTNANTLLIQLDLEDIISGHTVTTFRCHHPTANILGQLQECIDRDIELLYDIVAHSGNKHTLCFTKQESSENQDVYQYPL